MWNKENEEHVHTDYLTEYTKTVVANKVDLRPFVVVRQRV